MFSHPDSDRVGDRDLIFLRPVDFADPTKPGAAPDQQALWPAADERGLDRFEDWLAALQDGIISGEPRRVELAGRDAVYFEAEISDSYTCGTFGYCASFLINVITAELGISGWAFERGFHQRIWVVDAGVHAPLVVVASTASSDSSFQVDVDAFLERITIGEPGPHPLDPSAAVSAEDLVGIWVSEANPWKLRFNSDGT